MLGRECSHSSAVRTSSPLLECHKTGPDTPTRGAVILASRSAGRRFCLGSTHRAASCGEASRRADRPSTVLAMGRRWPLIGRIDELRFIAAAARSGDGPRGVVIAGGAGVGKTRLAREAV